MIKEHFDVVIVGAGPAGLKCAETLGQSSLSVLVIEKNHLIGPKVCAGGLTGKDIHLLDLPSHLIEYSFDRVNLHIGCIRTTVKAPYHYAYTIDRYKLGQWQLARLTAFSNITVRTSTRVLSIYPNEIHTETHQIGFRYLVGADGSNSLVRRYLGLSRGETGMAIQYIIPTNSFTEMELYFSSRLFKLWYVWIFPHKDFISVGCAANPNLLSGTKLKQNFNRWLLKKGFDLSNARYEAFPIAYDYQGHQFNNVFLAGDAGGFVSGLTGEGIYQALVTGTEIARTIIEPCYQSVAIQDILATKHFHNRIIRLLSRVGIFRSLLLFAGQLMFCIPRYKEKMIRKLA